MSATATAVKTAKPVYYFSIDWESLGPSFKDNGPNAIGITVHTDSGEEVECYKTGISTEGKCMNEDTKKYFWDLNPAALAWINESLREPTVVAAEILELWKKYSKLGTVKWMAYPASYDWAILVAFMDTYSVEVFKPFQCICISTWLDAYALMQKVTKERAKELLNFHIENPHFPDSDARAQAKLYFALMQELTQKAGCSY